MLVGVLSQSYDARKPSVFDDFPALKALVDTYERVNNDFPVRDSRPCITHCNFMSEESILKMKALGIVADIQPIWLHLDGRTLLKQFGEERTSYFQPYKTIFDQGVIVGGGSDHMQRIGSLRSVNPYDLFWDSGHADSAAALERFASASRTDYYS